MSKVCSVCGKEMGWFGSWRWVAPKKIMCIECYEKYIEEKRKIQEKVDREIEDKRFEDIIAHTPKIQCPYCKKWFWKSTKEQYRDDAELNAIKWAIVPAWGLAGSLKNKPFIQCPHCGMKIMQG